MRLQRTSVRAFSALCLVICLTACSQATSRAASTTTTVADVLEQQTAPDAGAPATDAITADATTFEYERGHEGSLAADDIDLTSMSSTAVYSMVSQMMSDPRSFVGKTVRAAGSFNSMHNSNLGVDYYFVEIADATACCAQGLEFVWGDGSHAFPADYPAIGTEIEVQGTFETYDEEGILYCHLVDAELSVA